MRKPEAKFSGMESAFSGNPSLVLFFSQIFYSFYFVVFLLVGFGRRVLSCLVYDALVVMPA